MFCAIVHGRGSVFFWAALRYLMYFRFMGDIIYTHSGPYGGTSMPLQRVTSLRRRAQAKDPAALYW